MLRKFCHVGKKEEKPLAPRARRILEEAAREQEFDIPILVTPKEISDERSKHLRELRNRAGNFEEDEARAVLETLAKLYPHIAIDVLHDAMDAVKEKTAKACMEGLR